MTDHNEYHAFKADEIPSQEISDPAVLSKNPLVSVHMITYNHEPYIAQAIEGVLMQETDFPIELVIGEDCSTDRTREIVLDYQEKHPDIIRVIISDKNVGMHANGRRTIKACRGKYIAFCEGDDYWHHPLKLQRQISFLEQNPQYTATCTDFNRLHQKRQLLELDCIKSSNLTGLYNNLKFKDILVYLGICTCSICGRADIIRNSVIENSKWKRQFGIVDIMFSIELAASGQIGFLPDSMATYRILEESAAHSRDIRKIYRFQKDTLRIRMYYARKYKQNETILRKIRQNYCNCMLKLCFRTYDPVLTGELKKFAKDCGFRMSLKHKASLIGGNNYYIHKTFLLLLTLKRFAGRIGLALLKVL